MALSATYLGMPLEVNDLDVENLEYFKYCAAHDYSEVHHAIQPAFKQHTPYLILLVDLDTQKGKPTEVQALRVVGNLATPDGKLAPPDMVKTVGVGTRVRMVFSAVAPGLSLPQWTIDESASQPA